MKAMRALNATVVIIILMLAIGGSWSFLNWLIFNKAEPEVHLIPDGYVGPVAIAFSREDGEPKKYEDGKRLYVIPTDGVLKTKLEPNDGTQHRWEFYYEKADGMRVSIPEWDVREESLDPNRIAIFSIHVVSAPNIKMKKPMSFFTYIVGKPKDVKVLTLKQHEIVFNRI